MWFHSSHILPFFCRYSPAFFLSGTINRPMKTSCLWTHNNLPADDRLTGLKEFYFAEEEIKKAIEHYG